MAFEQLASLYAWLHTPGSESVALLAMSLYSKLLQGRCCSSEPDAGAQGDNDPVDVVEIGEQRLTTGNVYPVKPLAVLAMIDDGELDWKIIAIRADDPRAAGLNDVEDVERCECS